MTDYTIQENERILQIIYGLQSSERYEYGDGRLGQKYDATKYTLKNTLLITNKNLIFLRIAKEKTTNPFSNSLMYNESKSTVKERAEKLFSNKSLQEICALDPKPFFINHKEIVDMKVKTGFFSRKIKIKTSSKNVSYFILDKQDLLRIKQEMVKFSPYVK